MGNVHSALEMKTQENLYSKKKSERKCEFVSKELSSIKREIELNRIAISPLSREESGKYNQILLEIENNMVKEERKD